MDIDSWLKLSLLGVLILASGFFSGSEAAFFGLGLYRVRRLQARSMRSFQVAQRLLGEPTKLISTLLTGNELVNAAIGVIGTSLVYAFLRGQLEPKYVSLVVVLLILPFVLIFGEIIPKTFALRFPEAFVRWSARPLAWFSQSIAPVRNSLAWFTEKMIATVSTSKGEEKGLAEDVFRSMVDAGTQEGVLDVQEQELIHNVFQLDDVRVSQIMMPADQVSTLRSGMKMAKVMQHIEMYQFSRYPVLHENEESVVGVVYTKDLLRSTSPDPTESVNSYLRSPLLIPSDMNAMELFFQFRARQTHFGVVVQPASKNMIGIVTLEDVLEEIFGDIRDERDMEEEKS